MARASEFFKAQTIQVYAVDMPVSSFGDIGSGKVFRKRAIIVLRISVLFSILLTSGACSRESKSHNANSILSQRDIFKK
jgi:hypothetical protein